jgi:carbamoyl-phosphate synthase large subunit
VLLDRFLNDAIEVDVDAIVDAEGEVLIGGVMEHIEEAGVHSGDSACSLPPYTLGKEVQDELRRQVAVMGRELNVIGLMNTQFAIQGDTVYVLEVNPRASRSVPFVSKVCGLPLAKIAARCMAGITLVEQGVTEEVVPEYYSVKESVFPFIKFPGVDALLGPEMKSTGEVMGVGKTFGEAFAKAQRGASAQLPKAGKAFISVREQDKSGAVEVAKQLQEKGFEILATDGTSALMKSAGVAVTAVNKVTQGRPHIVDMIKNGEVSLIVNTTEGKQSIKDSYTIRREAMNLGLSTYTTLSGAKAACMAIDHIDNCEVSCLQDLHATLKK